MFSRLWPVVISEVQLELSLSVQQRRQAELVGDILFYFIFFYLFFFFFYLFFFPEYTDTQDTCCLTLRRLMSYIYGAPILDVSRSHTTTQHSRQDSSGRVISSSQRPLPDNTRHSQQTNIHAPGGIGTQDLSRRAACGRSPAERSPTDCAASLCVIQKHQEQVLHIYIYDIRSLRVNDLTLTLLTQRKW